MTYRTYSFPRWRIAVGSVGLTFMVALSFTPLLDPASVELGVLWITGPIEFAILAFWFLVAARRRVHETSAGLSIITSLGLRERVLAWKDIDHFEARGVKPCAIDHHGRGTLILGLDAKAETTWDDGVTTDIVSELNARLKWWHGSA
jgi:hypothetical protein